MKNLRLFSYVFFALLFLPILLLAEEPSSLSADNYSIAGIRIEFLIFALTLLGVAFFHHHTLGVAVSGLVVLVVFKLAFTTFDLFQHLQHEKMILLNLLGLLLGFSLLSRHFEESKVPDWMPDVLPDDWKGGLLLLTIVMILSAFLDNIAAAMIGGSVAGVVYKHKVHIGFLAAIVAASNAGGAGSVLGDTTTTMMWIDGVSAIDVLHATVGSLGAFCFFAVIAAKQQDRYQGIIKDAPSGLKIDYGYLAIVILILAGAISTNIYFDLPALGVWIAIFIGAFFRKTDWSELKGASKGALFLLSLVLSASMMPVEELPTASWQTAFGLGFLSSVFDNIPLTKLALQQGGYDWGVLAYAVGYGGSMIWFGSSAGVALSNHYPDARSVGEWVKSGWHVIVGYVIGFFVLLWVFGWEPHAPHKDYPSNGAQTTTYP